MQYKFFLSPAMFTEKEKLILDIGTMRAYAFTYSTGVAALRVENEKGYFIILPFQGQQIWRVKFLGRSLTMRTSFDEPVPTLNYLETYGGFMLHCGVCGMGVPGPKDVHPQHGELPNAQYRTAWLLAGEDERGAYIGVSGEIAGKVSFVRNYLFTPECRLYAGETILRTNVRLQNLRSEPFTYMYLCHINFRPIDGAELMYSTKYDKEHITVHKIISPNAPKEKAEPLAAYMDAVQENPALHHKVGAPGQYYDPEICFTVHYMADKDGMAHTMERLPDGTAFYVSHPVDALPYAIRWISRTGDEDSMGMVLPATAEHFGYTYAKEHGQLNVLPPKSEISFSLKIGLLDAGEAEAVAEKIKKITK